MTANNAPEEETEPTSLTDEELAAASGGQASRGDGIAIASAEDVTAVIVE